MNKITLGIEVIRNRPEIMNSWGQRVALLYHQASLDSKFNQSLDIIHTGLGKRLTKLFGPQHGACGDVQDNMIETPHTLHPVLNIPVYSLYSETRSPTAEMLEGLDTLVVDLQDVGTRVYTYIQTLFLVMKECYKQNIKIVILDRPNPLGGEILEGTTLRTDQTSFVGLTPIPMRHSLTIGEYAKFLHKSEGLTGELDIVEMQGYKKSFFFEETNLPWVNPSPNLPTAEGAYCYPGTVMLEGTSLSEGRGTTRPLEVIAHPQLDSHKWARFFNEHFPQNKWGAFFRPVTIHPMFHKFSAQACQGLFIHPLNLQLFRPWALTLEVLKCLWHSPEIDYSWAKGPYEYEFDRNPFDVIHGDLRIREWIEQNGELEALLEIEAKDNIAFKEITSDLRIYS